MASSSRHADREPADETEPLLGHNSPHNNTLRHALTRPSPWHVVISMFLVTVAAGAIYAPQIQLYTEVFCNRYYDSKQTPNDTVKFDGDTTIPFRDCSVPEVQQIVAEVDGVIQFLTYGSTLLMSGFYGRLSDTRGRKFVVQSCTLGLVINTLCSIVTMKFQKYVGVTLLFVGPLIRGLMGGDSPLQAAIQAYLSDCTSVAERTVIFGRLLGVMLFGILTGSSLAGAILKSNPDVLPVICAAGGMYLLTYLYAALVLPESIPKEILHHNRTTSDSKQQTLWQRLNVFTAVAILFDIKPDGLTRYAIPLIALVQFLVVVVIRPPLILYAMLEFGWTGYESSLYVSALSFARLAAAVFVLPLITSLFLGRPDADEQVNKRKSITFNIWVMRLASFFDATGFLLMALALNATQFTLAGILQCFSVFSNAAIGALVTSIVDPSHVGKVLGAFSVLQSVGMLFALWGMNVIYGATVAVMPTFVIYFCGGIAAITVVCAAFVTQLPKQSSPE